MADLKPQELIRDDLEIRTAVLSVFNKTPGLFALAQELNSLNVEIFASGSTYKALMERGIRARPTSDLVSFVEPETLDGRVKTLHPEIYMGILAARNNPEHMATLERHHVPLIDMVVVDIYPFEKKVAEPGVTFEGARENIDIGGITLGRAPAKAFDSVLVVSSEEQYQKVINELKERDGKISYATRLRFAGALFRLTSGYDAAIADYMLKRLVELETGTAGKAESRAAGRPAASRSRSKN